MDHQVRYVPLKSGSGNRVAINTRNAAVSADDRYLLVGNYLPHNLVLLDARDLSLIKVIDAVDSKGKTSRVSAVYTARPRDSFMIAMKDIKEIWELNYSDDPPAGFGAIWNHDYREESGDAVKEKFPIRKLKTEHFMDDFFFDQSYASDNQFVARWWNLYPRSGPGSSDS